MQNYIALFFTGLLTGGVSCMAVQGGLLAAALAAGGQKPLLRQDYGGQTEDGRQRTESLNKKAMISGTVAFLGAKLVSHILLGAVLGSIGGALTLSVPLLTVLQIIASFFMIGTAGNLMQLHPIFRYFVIQPPRWAGRFLRARSKSGEWFVPAILGFFTFLIPCGATQAVMAQSIASGSAWNGALTLGSFTLGTIPVFFILGAIMGGLSATGTVSKLFTRLAGAIIIILACWNLWNVAGVWGTTGQFERVVEAAKCQFIYCENQDGGQRTEDRIQNTTTAPKITIEGNEYVVDNPNIPTGKEITLTVTNVSGESCIQAFTIPSLKYFKIIPVGKSETITFTAPSTPGDLPFSCSMGMYRGTLRVQ